MFGRNFAGRGQRSGMELGFRGSSPDYPYIGRGRGGLPRCGYLSGNYEISQQQDINLLKSQAAKIKKNLDLVEARIRELEAVK